MNKPTRVLVVEDEAAQRRLVADILRREGWEVAEAESGEDALAMLQKEIPDLVLSDWKMPGLDGGGLLGIVRERGWSCAFVVMTAYGSIAHAVEAIRRGADDYLAKPFERESLRITVQRALKAFRLERENRQLKQEVSRQEGFGEICGRAGAMQVLYRTLRKVAATDATVLITGESGTGKELAARTLHAESRRREGPFVAVNCAAIPETLMESELFGHEKGAFTGADRRREGKFEEAAGGTLFLDEIASMPLALQAVLLRVLQEKRLTRLGGKGEVALDVRVVAATNRDLRDMVREGAFREDLYYRLDVVPVHIPPLRERREDVLLLARLFLERHAEHYGVKLKAVPPAIWRRLEAHRWPGNVRELANAMERLVLLSDEGALREEDLPETMAAPPEIDGCPFRLPPAGISWDSVEAGLLRQALDLAQGNRAEAARLLGLGYKAFLYRLEKLGEKP